MIYIYVTCMYLLYIEWSTDILPHKQNPSMNFFHVCCKNNCQLHSQIVLSESSKTNGGCDQNLLDLDALLRALQRICLATMAAQGWVAYVACVDCWRLVMKISNQSKRKAWDAKFYTTATCNRSWNAFHRSMADFIGRFFHIEILRRFRHAPNLQLQEDSLAKKSHWCQGKCAGQFEVQPLQGLDINKSVTS